MKLFNTFEKEGELLLPHKNFSDIPFTPHASFPGVELKHLITGKDTQGRFSYHLVRIAPYHKIGEHLHETQLETHEIINGLGTCTYNGHTFNYHPGVIAILPEGTPHEIEAGEEGLFLFAKFIPALL